MFGPFDLMSVILLGGSLVAVGILIGAVMVAGFHKPEDALSGDEGSPDDEWDAETIMRREA